MVQMYGVIENRGKSLCTVLKHPLLCIYGGIAKKDIPMSLKSPIILNVPDWYGPGDIVRKNTHALPYNIKEMP